MIHSNARRWSTVGAADVWFETCVPRRWCPPSRVGEDTGFSAAPVGVPSMMAVEVTGRSAVAVSVTVPTGVAIGVPS